MTRLVASLTFLAVAGRKVQLEIFKHFAVPINLERVLHRDQKIRFHPADTRRRQAVVRLVPRLGHRGARHRGQRDPR